MRWRGIPIGKKIIAAILSFMIPGLGQLYSGRTKRGIIIFSTLLLTIYISTYRTWAHYSYFIEFISPSGSDTNFIYNNIFYIPYIFLPYILIVVFGLIAALDAYRVTPKIGVVLWQTTLITSILFIYLSYTLMYVLDDTGFGLLLIPGLLILLFSIGTMFSETKQSIFISQIRNTVAQMGFAPKEVEEITSDVVRYLKIGKYKRLEGSEGLVEVVAAISVSPAEWTEITGPELVSVIKDVLEIRERKKY